MRSTAHRRRRALLVVAAGLAIAVLVVLARRQPEPRTEQLLPLAPVDAQEHTHGSTEPLERAEVAFEVQRTAVATAEDPTSSADEPEPVDATPDAPGRVRITAIDAWSGVPVDRLRARALSETRFAEREGEHDESALEFVLTPGTYDLFVTSGGYEPVEVARVSIERGRTLVLDPLRMQPGSARIVGSVRGDAPLEDEIHVELLGHGRRPCAECAGRTDPVDAAAEVRGKAWRRNVPCKSCGFTELRSRKRVLPHRSFLFEGLASSAYSARLVDARGRTVGAPAVVELAAGDSGTLTLDAWTFRSVRVELLDTDGTSLADEWGTRVRRENALGHAESAEKLVPVQSWECELQLEGRPFAKATFSTPTLEGYGASRSFSGRLMRRSEKRSRDDRPRTADHALRPRLVAPHFEIASFKALVDEDGLVRFVDVPAYALALSMRCGRYRAVVLLPASIAGESIRAKVELHEDEVAAQAGTVSALTFREFDMECYR